MSSIQTLKDDICISCNIGPEIRTRETLYDDIIETDDGQRVCCLRSDGNYVLKEV